MATFYAGLPGRPIDPRAVQNAVFCQVFEFLPDDGVAAVVQRDTDNAPIVAAVAEDRLYLLEVLDADESGFVGSSCQLVNLKPGCGTVEVETRYRADQTNGQSPPRATVWRFGLPGDKTLTIETFVVRDDEVEDAESLARGIAQATGWRAEALV